MGASKPPKFVGHPYRRYSLASEEERHLDAEPILKQEAAKRMPAAKCRECDIITWDVSIADGLTRCRHPHKKGCSKPPGRLDLLRDIPLAKRSVVLGGRLLRPMSDATVAAAAKELEWTS